jgi:transglutaminase-like putative cysteine protease
VEVEVIAKLQVINPFDYFVEEYAEEFPFTYDQMLQQELTAYLNLSEESPIFLKFMEGLKLNQSIPNDFLVSINQAVYKELSYNLRMEVGVQTPEETLRIKRSCRDFAWLLIHVLRHFGLAARFVSGYIVQLSQTLNP